MNRFLRHKNRFFAIGLLVSLAIHALVLFIESSRPATERRQSNPTASRLDVTLQKEAPPPTPAPEVMPAPPAPPVKPREPRKERPKIITARPDRVDPTPTWSTAEREDMDKFLDQLAVEARPKSGRELANKALAMAGSMRTPVQEDGELKEMWQKLNSASVDPFSIELYFDALFRKMNRSAAMLPQEDRVRGHQVAAVRVVVDKSGAVKSFRVLWAADQQAEIDYIKAVVDMASPFPMFPADIRAATDSVVLQICIQPRGTVSSGGTAFSRMAPGQNCRPG